MKIFKAEQLTRTPGRIFREVDRAYNTGERVIITHASYPDRVFEFKALDSESISDEKECKNV